MLSAREFLLHGIRRRVGDGETSKLWEDRWLKDAILLAILQILKVSTPIVLRVKGIGVSNTIPQGL